MFNPPLNLTSPFLPQFAPRRPRDMGSGEGSGEGGLCPGLLWAILWFIGLIFIAWPVGFFIAWLYIFLLPFGACITPIKDLCDALLKLVQFPFTFAQNMVNMKPCCS